MSKEKQREERYVKGTYEKVSSAWWVIALGFFVIWGIVLLFDIMEARKLTLFVFTAICTDIQLATSVLSIFGITFGWAILENIAERMIFTYHRNQGKHIPDRIQTFISFTSLFWLILLFLGHYLTVFTFNDYGLYVIIGCIYALVLVIYFKTTLEVRLIKLKKWKKIIFSEDQSNFYVPYEKMFFWFAICGILLVFFYYYNFGETSGILWAKSIGDLFLAQIMYNPVVITLLIVALVFTVFYPLVDFAGVILLIGCYKLITTQTKEKIRAVRKYIALFVLITVVWKMLDVFGINIIDPSIEVLLGLLIMIIVAIIKGRISKTLAV